MRTSPFTIYNQVTVYSHNTLVYTWKSDSDLIGFSSHQCPVTQRMLQVNRSLSIVVIVSMLLLMHCCAKVQPDGTASTAGDFDLISQLLFSDLCISFFESIYQPNTV